MISGIRTHIFIGNREVLRCPLCRIESVRHRPLSSASITLSDPTGDLFRSIGNEDVVEIIFGYRNEEPSTWKGLVTWRRWGSTKDQIVIGAIGKEEKVLCSQILQAWENETPEAIMKWAIGQAGMAAGRIDSPGITIPRFAAGNIPVWQVARQCAYTCQKAFGIDMSRWALWMDAAGSVNWGDFDEGGDVSPVIATGAGLIKHLPADDTKGLNMVEMFLLSGFAHSMKFRLTDTRRGIDDEFRALSVLHEIKDRSVRTFIGYGEEYEKY